MFFLYDLLAGLYLLVASPYYLYRMVRTQKYRSGLGERFGRIVPERIAGLRGRKLCWIHAVSVGEVHAAEMLIQRIKQRRPEVAVVVSTVTDTGQERARRIAEADATLYLPLDLGPILRRVFRRIHPEVFVIVETELWPRLLSVLHAERIPILVLNGRISDRSYGRYRLTRGFWRRVLGWVDCFAMQTDLDAERIRSMGAPGERVSVMGNMKFDRVPPLPSPEEAQALRGEFGLCRDNRLWVAGSTFPGEERRILDVYLRLKKRFASLRLLLAPRNPERAEAVEGLVREKGLECLRRSVCRAEPSPEGEPVILLDTMGELAKMYALADYVFIGKSLDGWGGQNPLEPAALCKPIVFGPHMENFREAERLLLDAGGAVQVQDEAGLEQTLSEWFQSPDTCRRLGEGAVGALRSRQGATERNLDLILSRLPGGREKGVS